MSDSASRGVYKLHLSLPCPLTCFPTPSSYSAPISALHVSLHQGRLVVPFTAIGRVPDVVKEAFDGMEGWLRLDGGERIFTDVEKKRCYYALTVENNFYWRKVSKIVEEAVAGELGGWLEGQNAENGEMVPHISVGWKYLDDDGGGRRQHRQKEPRQEKEQQQQQQQQQVIGTYWRESMECAFKAEFVRVECGDRVFMVDM